MDSRRQSQTKDLRPASPADSRSRAASNASQGRRRSSSRDRAPLVPPNGTGSGMKSFKQQQLKAWQPVLTPVSVIAMLLIIFVIFLPIGILLEDCSNRVIEQSIRYDNIGECDDV